MEWEKTPDLVNNDFIYFLYIIYINKYKMLIIVICTIVLFFLMIYIHYSLNIIKTIKY